MKKLILLFLSVMAFAGMTLAQDVYMAGSSGNSLGSCDAALYLNGELYYYFGGDASCQHSSSDVLCLNGDVYWVDNCMDEYGAPDYGDVFKNDERFLCNPIHSKSSISCLFTDGKDVYSAGSTLVDGVLTPVVWKNDVVEPYIVFDYEGFAGHITDAVIVDDVVYACGLMWDDFCMGGVLLIQDEETVLCFGEGLIPSSMTCYDYDLYFAISDYNNLTGLVYKNDSLLYTLTTQGNVRHISVDAGDIYVTGVSDDKGRVWKNGEELYDFSFYANAIEANSEGVFYAGVNDSHHGQLWKDGAPVYELEGCTDLHAVAVDPNCQDDTPRSLPFFDGFETGATDWSCWTVIDNDHSNIGYFSYWHRIGMNNSIAPATGDRCASHSYGETMQEGWLVTPYLSLPADGTITLSFKTYEQWPEDLRCESVWLGTEDNDYELWTQTEPSEEWKAVTIDISDYRGQVAVVGFKYAGEDGHVWCIDDVSIVRSNDVDENEGGGLALYPNPAQERISIKGLKADGEVKIYNVLGELVKTTSVSANQEIGIGELTEGVYVVRCGNATLRFVKE